MQRNLYERRQKRKNGFPKIAFKPFLFIKLIRRVN